MSNAIETDLVALAQSIVAPGYGLRLTGVAPNGIPNNFYGATDEENGGYVYSVWFDDPGCEAVVLVQGLGTFTTEFDRSVVATLPAGW